MLTLFNVVLPVFLIAGTAAISQRWLQLDPRPISRVTFYIFASAQVFHALSRAALEQSQMGEMLVALLVGIGILWMLGAWITRKLGLGERTRSAFLLAVLLTNVGNYGLPVILVAFGEPGLVPGIIYLVLFNVILIPIGIYIAAQGKASAREALRRVAGVPAIYAAALGLLFNLSNWTLPESVDIAVEMLAQAANPVFLVVLGIQLLQAFETPWDRRLAPALGSVVVLRLFVAPPLFWGVGQILGLRGLPFEVFVLEGALPTAVLAGVLASEFDAAPEFATLCIFATTSVSLVTVPLVLYWLGA